MFECFYALSPSYWPQAVWDELYQSVGVYMVHLIPIYEREADWIARQEP